MAYRRLPPSTWQLTQRLLTLHARALQHGALLPSASSHASAQAAATLRPPSQRRRHRPLWSLTQATPTLPSPSTTIIDTTRFYSASSASSSASDQSDTENDNDDDPDTELADSDVDGDADGAVASRSRGTSRQQPHDTATPAMRQYFRMKEQAPGFLLLFRLGDFYEMFYDDAVKAAAILDITLTSRHVKARSKSAAATGEKAAIPMCGIPAHALDNYLERLIKRGVMVAVCDQVEDAATKRAAGGSSGGIIRREITRLVTPGTLLDDRFLHPRRNNYLVALAPATSTRSTRSSSNFDSFGLAWVDISTGAFQCSTCDAANIANELYRLSPSELVIPEWLYQRLQLDNKSNSVSGIEELDDSLRRTLSSYFVRSHSNQAFSSDNTRPLFDKIRHATTDAMASPSPTSTSDSELDLDAFLKSLEVEEVAACGGVLSYVETSQKGRMPAISLPRKSIPNSTMIIDKATRNALELSHTIQGPCSAPTVLLIADCWLLIADWIGTHRGRKETQHPVGHRPDCHRPGSSPACQQPPCTIAVSLGDQPTPRCCRVLCAATGSSRFDAHGTEPHTAQPSR